MSDFDKEAERERLREKYERDQKKREATEQMSELLLKGATMTNAHCDQCGDPIFRYDGQEFCPSCEEVVGVGGEAAADDAAEKGGAATEGSSGAEPAENGAEVEHAGVGGAESDATAESEADTAVSADSADAAGAAGATDAPTRTQDTPASTPQRDAPAAPSGGSSAADPSETAPSGRSTASPSSSVGQAPEPAPATGGDGDLADARESLVRTLVSQTRQAEACEDPRRARDHLAAAREAAEALSALPY